MDWMIMSPFLAYTFNTSDGTRHDLVEDVVRTLQRLLGDDTSLLQQIYEREEIGQGCSTRRLFEYYSISTYKSQYQHQPVYQ